MWFASSCFFGSWWFVFGSCFVGCCSLVVLVLFAGSWFASFVVPMMFHFNYAVYPRDRGSEPNGRATLQKTGALISCRTTSVSCKPMMNACLGTRGYLLNQAQLTRRRNTSFSFSSRVAASELNVSLCHCGMPFWDGLQCSWGGIVQQPNPL